MRKCGARARFTASKAAACAAWSAIFAARAACSLLATPDEVADLSAQFARANRALPMENGVDFDFFDPAATRRLARWPAGGIVVFVGGHGLLPERRCGGVVRRSRASGAARDGPRPGVLVVGRDPTPAVRALAGRPGIQVTGAVADVRPYLQSALAAVAPLRIARGVQNKVLEALAMGLPVMASREVCRTLDPLPPGVIPCDSARGLRARFARRARSFLRPRFAPPPSGGSRGTATCRSFLTNYAGCTNRTESNQTRERQWAPAGS